MEASDPRADGAPDASKVSCRQNCPAGKIVPWDKRGLSAFRNQVLPFVPHIKY